MKRDIEMRKIAPLLKFQAPNSTTLELKTQYFKRCQIAFAQFCFGSVRKNLELTQDQGSSMAGGVRTQCQEEGCGSEEVRQQGSPNS